MPSWVIVIHESYPTDFCLGMRKSRCDPRDPLASQYYNTANAQGGGGCSFWKVRDRHDKLDVVLSPDTEEEPESGCFSERGTSLGGCAGESGEATASALH